MSREETTPGGRDRLAQWFADPDLSGIGGTVVLLLLSFGQDLDRIHWRVISRAWHITVAEAPTLFRELHLHQARQSLSYTCIMRGQTSKGVKQFVQLSGARLVHLQVPFATNDLLEACETASPHLRHLLLAPCPYLSKLPTVWTLETLDVRGSLEILPLVPKVCASLKHLKLGWWKESDPPGDGGEMFTWVQKWGALLRRDHGTRDLLHSLAMQAKELHVLHFCGLSCRLYDYGALANLVQIEELHLPYAGLMNASCIARLSEITSLKALNLRAVDVDAPDLRNLEFLNMSCTGLTPASLTRLASRCPRLRVLDLCYAEHLDRSVLPMLAGHHHPLEMLGLGGFDLTDGDLALIVRTWQGLRNLGIGSAHGVTGQGLRGLLLLPGLKALCAHKLTQLEEAVVWDLLPQLAQIDLERSTWATPASQAVLAAIEARPYDFDYL